MDALKDLFLLSKQHSNWELIWKSAVVSAVVILEVGFYLRMLFECGFKPGIRSRFTWLVFVTMATLFGAQIYYWVTRSSIYGSRENQVRQ
jgi:hypothetical protein